MLSIKRIKDIKSLHQKKFRRIEKQFVLEGNRLINQAIAADIKIIEVWITQKNIESPCGQKIIEKLKNKNIPFSSIPNKIIRQMSDSLNSQGIIALVPIPKYKTFKIPPKKALYLDEISDPGNMGTILRSAAWFGIKSIFLSTNCVDPFNSKVVRSGMGAHFYFTHFEICNDIELFEKYSKSQRIILGTGTNGTSIKSFNFNKDNGWLIVLGNESRGLSEISKKYISSMVSIPGIEGMESLNVSIAGGILMYILSS